MGGAATERDDIGEISNMIYNEEEENADTTC